MTVLLLLACSEPPPPPEPEPEPTPEPAPEPTVWHTERDPIGRWTAEVPADMKRSTKLRAFERLDEEGNPLEDPPEFEWIEMSGRSNGTLKSKVDVGWLPRPGTLEDPMTALISMARIPEDAEQGELSGAPSRVWTTQGALGHWTNAVVAADSRLYYLRFQDSEDERATASHDRFFDSFTLLSAEDLTEEDQKTIANWEARKAAEEAQANAEPLTRAQIEANRELVKAIVLEQVGFLSCTLESGASRQAILKLSVNDGEISSLRVYGSTFSIGGRGEPTKERTDSLARCLKSAAAKWSFPEGLTASNVQVPFTFF